jgi:hypothetical protein
VSPRLIPWCLAATGFVAAFSVFGLHGERGGPVQQLPGHPAVANLLIPPATDHQALRSSTAPAAPDEPGDEAQPLTLPLPPATQPEPDSGVGGVIDDQPTVDDLPSPRSLPESTEND